jgi:RNA polymerase sigma-70 factor (ECF subfamily)
MPATRNPLENEASLIRAAQRGNVDSFNILVEHYQNSVYTLAYRLMGESHSAGDAAQDAFIAAYRRLETYRGGNFRAWLLRITANQCYDALRRYKRQPNVSLEDVGGEEDEYSLLGSGETPEQAAERGELRRAVQNCISALAPDQRLVLVLSDVEGFDYQAIADQAQIALGTVKSRLSRARAAIRDCLRGAEELIAPQLRL